MGAGEGAWPFSKPRGVRRESPLAVSTVWSEEKALFGVTLCINEPCLKGRAYKRFGSFSGRQESPRAAREPGTPEGCSGGMLRPPPSAGTKQAGHGSVAVLREHKLSHQEPLIRVPSAEQAPSEPARGASSIPVSAGPRSAPRGGAAPPPPAPGQLSPGFLPSPAGTPCPHACGGLFPRTEPPTRGSPGQRRGSAWLRSCRKPGSNRNHPRVQRSERLRRLGGVSCGDRTVGLTRGLKNTRAGTLHPVLARPRAARAPERLLPGSSAPRQELGQLSRPHPLSLSRTLPKPTLRSFHTPSVLNAASEPGIPGCGIHQEFRKLLLGN